MVDMPCRSLPKSAQLKKRSIDVSTLAWNQGGAVGSILLARTLFLSEIASLLVRTNDPLRSPSTRQPSQRRLDSCVMLHEGVARQFA